MGSPWSDLGRHPGLPLRSPATDHIRNKQMNSLHAALLGLIHGLTKNLPDYNLGALVGFAGYCLLVGGGILGYTLLG
jgi:hypothetical protein